METTAKVSVIIPVYKVEEYLDRCVESVVNQSFRELEILLVDDGSPDRCGAMCDAWAEKDSRIRVLHKENGGLSDARNAGFEASSAEYVIFIDSDDYIEPEMLEVLYSMATEHSADVAACGIIDRYEGVSAERSEREERFVCTGREALGEVLRGKKIPGGIVDKLIRRETMGSHRFLKGKTYEDAFFTPELLLAAGTVAVTTRGLYNYWHRAGSITTLPFNEKAMDVVEAYDYTAQLVRERCPELQGVARFRQLWARFTVFDRMLQSKDYHSFPQYAPTVRYLKSVWREVLHCPYFQRSRRIAAVALRLGVPCYHALLKIKEKNSKVYR